ncbi:hypothetical protein [Sphingobacterium bambusae]|uniref:Uncharacterized protein n=1 Tax=Sphingobacterium bambusae TaxID=662858 RepID=A0ABW6BNT6_9SPHI|nr:hypothetical protein [Sphingobacterium bambusae]WPL47879.1 hypothetical protein SCB77_18175 [Sphingobacterium bambusae]
MKDYYLNNNQQNNGDYEVHALGCTYFPKQNYVYLGQFLSCQAAVLQAKQEYPYRKINGCYYCSNPCHTS